ncbi:tyrosine-type recombinase/integrase [Komagataeibacter medellinensis]|uniref:Phage integrase n=1 Tax=Komagataeibacter medellinensis (strain NBRC 3288 / BCRC 11682 / LMG 1693 / Kondo 51) TaxID=634177 RepID=G2I7A3_KOMMN|nr:site-specific integrase [Komagataeibacter medellinensis]BAK84000.1 phage integrase [Komagataeibacter medellinensis NBRC 3288]
MSRLAPHQLTARKVDTLKNGVLADGGNLWVVARHPSKVWTFRYTSPLTGKRRELGIGSATTVSLAEARRLAAEARNLMAQGIDPIDRKREEEAARKKLTAPTFEEVSRAYIKDQAPGWRDPRAVDIWTSSLTRFAFPVCGARQVNAVDTDDVLAIIRPLWSGMTETASRLRGRIERILDYARTSGWREGENPARWKGHLAAILPKPAAVAKVKHHAAVPRQDLPAVMDALSRAGGIAAYAVRFVCLTAARSGEVRSAVWSEVDLDAKVWIIPKEKMKAGREHRVPLSDGALTILRELLPLRDAGNGDLVFPGQKTGKPLSDVALSKALHLAAGTKDVTVHGLRSTFRDWAAEETDYPREVAEMALAHAIGNKVEAAYRRGDLFEKRQEMMKDWEQAAISVRRS